METGKVEDTPRSRFLSLKWRGAIALSIIIMSISASIVVITDWRATQGFAELNAQRDQAHFRSWIGRLKEGRQVLERLASLVPLLQTRGAEPDASQGRFVRQVLGQHGALLDIEWGIESISFFDHVDQDQAGMPGAGDRHEVLAIVSEAFASDTPVGHVICAPGCVQYLAVPQLGSQNSAGGVLLLGRSLADSLLSFAEATGSDLVVLNPGGQGMADEPVPGHRQLTGWRVSVPLLSHPAQIFPLVQAMSEKHPLEALVAGRVFRFDGNWFHVTQMPDPDSALSYLLIRDVSSQFRQLTSTRRILLIAGLAGFLLTTLLLYLFLRAPLLRLQALVAMLPLIGKEQHAKARSRLPASAVRHGEDEIDLLVRAVARLNDHLEETGIARAEAEERLVWLADHDPLTGLINRRRFQQDFELIIGQALRHGHSGALLYFDLDDFKAVNDISGHQAGDQLLRLVASTLRDLVRSTDLFARLGGDEFAVVLPETGAQYAVDIGDKLLGALGQIKFDINGTLHRVSGSIGIAMFPEHGTAARELLANADLTMYEAKKKGRGRWNMFSDSDAFREVLASRTLWRDRIAQALEHDGFVLYFQPILNLNTNLIERHEVLIRMRGEDGGVIPPNDFIPIAEQTGQIGAIDRWVIDRALQLLGAHPALSLSVNLSGGVVDDPGLLDWLRPRLDGGQGINPKNLVFEITETAAVQNIGRAIDLMKELGSLGCQFAIDDFGSGFASFIYLKQMPVDLIKIDGAFIHKLADNADDQLFVRALSDVAHGLGKLTVAEFVEDARTLCLLRDFGVHYAQGYFIGRPAPGVDGVPLQPAPILLDETDIQL